MSKAKNISTVYAVGKGSFCFAYRLEGILTLSALGWEAERYQCLYVEKQTDFLTCIINPRDERFTYDLRIISQPGNQNNSRSRLTVYLLCRMDDTKRAQASRYAGDLLRYLEAHFTEYKFGLLEPKQLKEVLNPFTIKELLRITRRASRERLDTLQSEAPFKSIGFRRGEKRYRKSKIPTDSIIHIYPFIPALATMNNFFKLLLTNPNPVAVSARLKPTSLTHKEQAFLESQIAQCERYEQTHLGHSSHDPSTLSPTLREQAHLYKSYQIKFLFGLKDNAALATLEIASSGPIPKPLVDGLGNLTSEPAGGKQSALNQTIGDYLSGGYEIENLSRNQSTRQAFTKLRIKLAEHPLFNSATSRMLHLFDSIEAAALFRLPPATAESQTCIPTQNWKMHPAPDEIFREGALIGVTTCNGQEQVIRIGKEDRRRHVYVTGQTGTGKTTLLKTMALEDMHEGRGLCLIDPHGDLFKDLLGKIPKERIEDVVIIDPTDTDYPVGLNMLEYENENQRHFLVQEFTSIMTRIIEDEYGSSAVSFAGPIFFQHMRMNLLLAMSNPEVPGTLIEFYNIFLRKSYWRRWMPLRIKDPLLRHWVDEVLPSTNYTRVSNDGVSMGGYVGSKFQDFVFDPILRNIFGQKRSTIDIRQIMDEGKILLVNLAKGEMTEASSRFLGMILMAKILAAAMGRVELQEKKRREFHLYVDEFQSLATQSFITLLAEARKFGVSLVLANQFLSQIRDQRIIQAILGNVGTLICFRLGQADANLMEEEFKPVFTASNLIYLPNWIACVSTLSNGQAVKPFSIQTMDDSVPPKPGTADAMRKTSRELYGRVREEVEKEIEKSLEDPKEETYPARDMNRNL